MLDTKQQKQYFFIVLVLVVILSLMTILQRSKFKYVDTTDYNKPSQDFLNSQGYLKYLETVQTDPKASQQLFQTILTKDDITKEVEDALQTKQAVVPPAVDEKKLKISPSSSQAVNDYLTSSVSQAYSFSSSTTDLAKGIFDGDASAQIQLKSKLADLIDKLYALRVPKDALPLHKALITAYLSYANLLDAAKSYNPTDYTQNDAIWPQVYKNYVVANDSAVVYTNELNKLAAKYKVSYISVTIYAQGEDSSNISNIFIPKAQAFLGIGDTTFNFTLGDIPRIIMDAVKEGMRTAFLRFTGSMLNQLITKIEKNYLIANFLYYSDALVSGQYANDYLNKYVASSLDREMVKKFIPQFNCGQQNNNLKPVFKAKASEYLGFDPDTISPNDPEYFQKMAKVGNFMSSENGWNLYYQDLASQAQSAAQKAAQNELTSPGLKTPRSTTERSISTSINSIVSAEQASFNSVLQLGISNADSIISNLVAQLTQTLLNQFVFQGVSANNGAIGVYKEQPTCLAAAVLSPVLALPTTQYQNTTQPMTADAAMAQQCSYLTSLGSDCTTSVMNQLQTCANKSSADEVTKQNCSNLANSPYVNAMLGQCQSTTRPSYCSNLQSLLKVVH